MLLLAPYPVCTSTYVGGVKSIECFYYFFQAPLFFVNLILGWGPVRELITSQYVIWVTVQFLLTSIITPYLMAVVYKMAVKGRKKYKIVIGCLVFVFFILVNTALLALIYQKKLMPLTHPVDTF